MTNAQENSAAGPRRVRASVNYVGEMAERPCYFANDQSRNVLTLDPRTVEIADARRFAAPPSLEREGFALVGHRSRVAEFRDAEQVRQIHPGEIRELLLALTGADEIVVTGSGGLRFGERSNEAKGRSNARPARFIHVDVSELTARRFAARELGEAPGALDRYRRFAHYNVWRSFSPPPQDIPLAVCDGSTVAPYDLVRADAVFDDPEKPGAPPLFSFEGFLLRYNPAHRWSYFSDMTRDEALVFKTFDTDRTQPCLVPHTGFNDPSCPPTAVPRASIEMRAIALFRD